MDGGDSAGGSAALAELIDDIGECIYADLLEHYGLNLVTALREGSGYSPRQILVLIYQLPPGSRTVAEKQGGPEYVGWDVDRYLRALMIDALRENTYAFIAANSKRKPQPPEPVYRPGSEPTKNKRGAANPFAQMAASRIAAVRNARGG